MIRILAACFCALTFFTGTAEARQRHKAVLAHPDCNKPGFWPCEGVGPSPRGLEVQKAMGGFGSPQNVYKPRAEAGRIRQNRVVRAKAVRTETASYGALRAPGARWRYPTCIGADLLAVPSLAL